MSDKWILQTDRDLTTKFELTIGKTKIQGVYKQVITDLSMEYTDELGKILNITITDEGQRYVNNPYLISKGLPIKLSMGYTHDCPELFNGLITHCDASYDESGIGTIIIGATETGDIGAKLHKREFKQMTRSAIAKKLASEMGFKFKGVNTTEKIDINQDDESNIKILRALADAEELFLVVDNVTKTIYFGDRFEPFNKVPHIVHYGFGNFAVRKFQPQVTYKNASANSQSGTTDTKGKQNVEKAGSGGVNEPKTTKKDTKLTISGVDGKVTRK